MSTENVATESQNEVANTAPATGTAPDDASGNTLLSVSEAETVSKEETGTAPAEAPEASQQPEESNTEIVPDVYEFQDVEGIQVHDFVKASFADVAKELGLSQEKAQNVINKMAPAIQSAQEQQLAQISREWASQSIHDTEFGGTKFMENMGIAKQALNQFGSPALMEILDRAGLGNHPEIIRVFWKVGKSISPDTVISGVQAKKDVSSGDPWRDIGNRMFNQK